MLFKFVRARRLISLPAALAVGLVVFAISLIGGGSSVPRAEAQTETYYGSINIIFLITQEMSDDPAYSQSLGFSVSVVPTAESPNGCTTGRSASRSGPFDNNGESNAYGLVQNRADRRLIKRPAGQSQECSYNIVPAQHEDGPTNIFVLDDSYTHWHWGKRKTIVPNDDRNSDIARYHRYTVNTQPTFEPDVTFNVPVVDYDDDGQHDYAGAEFFAIFTAKEGSPGTSCAPADPRFRYEIQPQIIAAAGGQPARTQVELTATSPTTLIGSPSDSTHRCQYDVLYSAGDDHAELFSHTQMVNPRAYWQRFGRQRNPVPATDDFEVASGDPAAEVTYFLTSQNYRVTFEVDAPAAADAETFSVQAAPVVSSLGCSTHNLDPTGLTPASQQITDWPARHTGPDDRCEYVVTWPNTEDGGTTYRRNGPRTVMLDESVFSQTVQTLSNTYTTGTVMLFPEVSADLPLIDENNDGDHDMSGETFTWSFSRERGPNENTNCTDRVQAVYEIGDDGEVSLQGTRQPDASVAPGLELVGWHEDSTAECSYVVSFAGNNEFDTDSADPMHDVNLSWSDPRAHGVFETGRRQITARFQVTGLGVPDGTPITVEFRLAANAPAACADTRTTASDGWTQAGGVWSNTLEVGTAKSFVILGGVTVLPAMWRSRTAETCAYEVEWPRFEDPDAGGVAHNAYPMIAPESSWQPAFEDHRLESSPLFRVTYRAYYQRPVTHFTPNVSVQVPYDEANGQNRFANQTVTVTYRRAPGQSDTCTGSATDTFTIATGRDANSNNGVVTRTTTARLVDEPVVDRPGGTSRACSYVATAAATSALAAAAGDLSVVGNAEATIDAGGLVGSGGVPGGGPVRFAYESVFTARIGIDVPPGTREKLGEDGFESGDVLFKGAAFPVTFRAAEGVPAGCLPEGTRTVTFTIPDSSVAGLTVEGDVGFVDRVGGETTACSYTVEFPPQVDSTGVSDAIGYTLTLDAAAPAVISAADPSASSSYSLDGDLIRRLFVPPFGIAVPPTTAPDGTDSLYAGTEITVTYAASSGSGPHCAPARPSVVYVASPSTLGGFNPETADLVFVNQRIGDPSACSYTATLPRVINSEASVAPAWQLTLTNNVFNFDVNTAETTLTYEDTTGGGTSGGNGDGNGGTAGGNGGTGGTQTGNTQTGGTQPGNTGGTNVGNTGGTQPPVPSTPSGGTSRRPTTSGGGGGSRGGSSGGGGGSSSGGGGAATGPWVVAATSRVPVAVSLQMPERDFPVGAAIEVMLNVPGTCGEDVTAFAGLPAEVGLVYALTARSGTTADVLAAGALSLAGYAQRGDDTRDCEVRITLITAPAGCRLDSTSTNNVGTDDAGRSFVELTGGQSITSYSATPSLVCT